jgi:hypothetical protein
METELPECFLFLEESTIDSRDPDSIHLPNHLKSEVGKGMKGLIFKLAYGIEGLISGKVSFRR